MTRDATLAGYAVIVFALGACEWRARRGGRRATLGQFITSVAVWKPTRWPLLGAWLWLGWHLFARAHWG